MVLACERPASVSLNVSGRGFMWQARGIVAPGVSVAALVRLVLRGHGLVAGAGLREVVCCQAQHSAVINVGSM